MLQRDHISEPLNQKRKELSFRYLSGLMHKAFEKGL